MNDADAREAVSPAEAECAHDEGALQSAPANRRVIGATDKNHRLLFFNEFFRSEAKRVYGADAAVGMSLLDCIKVEADRDRLERHLCRALSGQECGDTEGYGPDAAVFYEATFQPMRDEAGNITGVLFFGINATDRLHLDRELRRQEQKFKALFMSMSDGFYLSDVVYDERGNPCDYRWVEVNPRFERISGLTREQIVGKRYTEIVSNDTTQWLSNYCRVAATGEPSTFEFYSNEYKAHFETYAYRTAEGQVAVIVRDVTERKRTEWALQNAQKLESLGILAGGIAHDFNNMLCCLFGYIELAQAFLSSHDVEDAVGELSAAMQTMDVLKSLTGQLLTFSKGGGPRRKVTQLNELIRKSCMLALSGSDIQCRFDIASDLAPCECDQNQLAQVLTNIVINAKEAMPSGGALDVVARNTFLPPLQHACLPEGGPFLRISIKDTGLGMSGDVMKSIFDPFFTTKKDGHGLGLSTTFSIVRRHGGLVDVESEPGAGSTFHLLFPAAPDRGAAAAVERRLERYEGRGPVLVMDDEASIRHVYREMIRMTGHTVVEARDGQEAVDLFREAMNNHRPFVLSIVDLTVRGGKGGMEILPELRELQPDAIVVVASGYSNDAVMANPMGGGFNDSLSKPFTSADITQLFLRLFRSEWE